MLNSKSYFSILLLLISNLCFSQYLSQKKALEDVNEFKTLLEKQSSYYQVSDFDFKNRFKELKQTIVSKDSVAIHFLAYEFEKLIAETIDRHANVKMDGFDEDNFKIFNNYFPFALASTHGKIVALKFNESKKAYDYYSKKYPYLKQINGVDIEAFLTQYAYRRKLSPKYARLRDGLRDLRDIGELYFKQGEQNLSEITVVLTNGKKDKELTLPLSHKRQRWGDIGSLSSKREFRRFIRDENFDLKQLDKWLTDSIAYLAIPAMTSYYINPNLESYLKSTMDKFKNTKALVIDIRGNGGGTRDILNTLSGYFVKSEQSPWVANVTYIRNDQYLDEDIESMQSRYLFNYDSDSFSDEDQDAIDTFNKTYKTEYTVNPERFSKPFYMVLHSNDSTLQCPVYILVNEECFSAASVFTSAFKGLPNIKIVGITTNGSSGRSKKFYLKNSNIRIKLSTMLSFQRNGKTLDGNGTKPDIVIEREEEQILGKSDSQLKKLITIINEG